MAAHPALDKRYSPARLAQDCPPCNQLAQAFGAARTRDALFLLAFITKPMTATAVMILSDRNEPTLADAVHKSVPEFRGGERERVGVSTWMKSRNAV